METDDPNDADYVVLGHVVCGHPCYEAGHALQLDLFDGVYNAYPPFSLPLWERPPQTSPHPRDLGDSHPQGSVTKGLP